MQFGMYTGIGTHERVHTSYINREEKETDRERDFKKVIFWATDSCSIPCGLSSVLCRTPHFSVSQEILCYKLEIKTPEGLDFPPLTCSRKENLVGLSFWPGIGLIRVRFVYIGPLASFLSPGLVCF